MLEDLDEFIYELYFSDDGQERILKILCPEGTSDVDFIVALKSFCADAEKNICDDGVNIAFDAESGEDRH